MIHYSPLLLLPLLIMTAVAVVVGAQSLWFCNIILYSIPFIISSYSLYLYYYCMVDQDSIPESRPMHVHPLHRTSTLAESPLAREGAQHEHGQGHAWPGWSTELIYLLCSPHLRCGGLRRNLVIRGGLRLSLLEKGNPKLHPPHPSS